MAAVEAAEGAGRGQSALAALDEGMVAGDEMQQHGRDDVGIVQTAAAVRGCARRASENQIPSQMRVTAAAPGAGPNRPVRPVSRTRGTWRTWAGVA